MTPQEIIRSFATAGHDLPRAAMQAAVDDWEAVSPALLQMLHDYLASPPEAEDVRRETQEALFFILHLCGQLQDKRAFAPLCELARRSEDTNDVEAILHDGVAETLTSILINCYDGDLAALQSVIEAAEADPFARTAALQTLVYLTAVGRLQRGEAEAYLRGLEARLQPREENLIWAQWVIALAYLGLGDMAPSVDGLFKRGWIPDNVIHRGDYDKTLGEVREADSLIDVLARWQIHPLGDAIETLSGWYGFSEAYKDELRKQSLKRVQDALFGDDEPKAPIAPERVLEDLFRKVGRNDPCPCGSGKKYKKCCLELARAS